MKSWAFQRFSLFLCLHRSALGHPVVPQISDTACPWSFILWARSKASNSPMEYPGNPPRSVDEGKQKEVNEIIGRVGTQLKLFSASNKKAMNVKTIKKNPSKSWQLGKTSAEVSIQTLDAWHTWLSRANWWFSAERLQLHFFESKLQNTPRSKCLHQSFLVMLDCKWCVFSCKTNDHEPLAVWIRISKK